MTFAFDHLEERTRGFMAEELAHDVDHDRIYYSPRLNDSGKQGWVDLMRQAFSVHDEDWLAETLATKGWIRTHENYVLQGVERERSTPKGAHTVIAHGAFNHYYIRAVCRVAAEDGIEQVEIYRAKQVGQPRPESQERIGTKLVAAEVLEALRHAHEDEVTLPVPSGPNSGLSVRLVRG